MNQNVPDSPEQALSLLSGSAHAMSRAHHTLRRALADAGIEEADVRTIMGVARDRSRRMDWLAMNVLRDRLKTFDEIDAVMKTFAAYIDTRAVVAHLCDADPGIFELPESPGTKLNPASHRETRRRTEPRPYGRGRNEDD